MSVMTTVLAILANYAASSRNSTTNATPKTMYMPDWLSGSVAASQITLENLPKGGVRVSVILPLANRT